MTLNNINIKEPNVRLYDSLINHREPCPPDLVKAAAFLMETSEAQIFIHVRDVIQQSDGSSCGGFTLAFAATLCAGWDPTDVKYGEKTMWPELIDNQIKMEMFPFGINDSSSRSVKKKGVNTSDQNVFTVPT